MTARDQALEQARLQLRARVERLVGEGPIARFDEALTHPSFSNESKLPDNQRLEFLGDAVLGLCVSELLVAAYPQADEGALTRMRSALVNADALARWARGVQLGEALALGKGARAGAERERTNVLADAVEAVIASVYDARGLEGARKLVADVIQDIVTDETPLHRQDPKSALQELVQARGLSAPTYHVKEIRGPQHEPSFVVEVRVGDVALAVGEGRSKKIAERIAAEAALHTAETHLGVVEGP